MVCSPHPFVPPDPICDPGRRQGWETGPDSQKAGRAGGQCSAKGVAAVRVQKYLKGGVVGQALAGTPGTAPEQHWGEGPLCFHPREETPARGHCRVAVTPLAMETCIRGERLGEPACLLSPSHWLFFYGEEGEGRRRWKRLSFQPTGLSQRKFNHLVTVKSHKTWTTLPTK